MASLTSHLRLVALLAVLCIALSSVNSVGLAQDDEPPPPAVGPVDVAPPTQQAEESPTSPPPEVPTTPVPTPSQSGPTSQTSTSALTIPSSPGRTGISHGSVGVAWDRVPQVTIAGAETDARNALVLDAVAAWNSKFREVGSGFQLGAVGRTAETVPIDYLSQLSEVIADGRGTPPNAPEVLQRIPGDLIVALSDGDFVSFSARLPGGRRLVAIKDSRFFPFTLPNVARNVIAHELGHAIGLGHNDDPAMLMCGRPAPCRPDLFRSAEERYFPLTSFEEGQLTILYPPGWRPGR